MNVIRTFHPAFCSALSEARLLHMSPGTQPPGEYPRFVGDVPDHIDRTDANAVRGYHLTRPRVRDAQGVFLLAQGTISNRRAELEASFREWHPGGREPLSSTSMYSTLWDNGVIPGPVRPMSMQYFMQAPAFPQPFPGPNMGLEFGQAPPPVLQPGAGPVPAPLLPGLDAEARRKATLEFIEKIRPGMDVMNKINAQAARDKAAKGVSEAFVLLNRIRTAEDPRRLCTVDADPVARLGAGNAVLFDVSLTPVAGAQGKRFREAIAAFVKTRNLTANPLAIPAVRFTGLTETQVRELAAAMRPELAPEPPAPPETDEAKKEMAAIVAHLTRVNAPDAPTDPRVCIIVSPPPFTSLPGGRLYALTITPVNAQVETLRKRLNAFSFGLGISVAANTPIVIPNLTAARVGVLAEALRPAVPVLTAEELAKKLAEERRKFIEALCTASNFEQVPGDPNVIQLPFAFGTVVHEEQMLLLLGAGATERPRFRITLAAGPNPTIASAAFHIVRNGMPEVWNYAPTTTAIEAFIKPLRTTPRPTDAAMLAALIKRTQEAMVASFPAAPPPTDLESQIKQGLQSFGTFFENAQKQAKQGLEKTGKEVREKTGTGLLFTSDALMDLELRPFTLPTSHFTITRSPGQTLPGGRRTYDLNLGLRTANETGTKALNAALESFRKLHGTGGTEGRLTGVGIEQMTPLKAALQGLFLEHLCADRTVHPFEVNRWSSSAEEFALETWLSHIIPENLVHNHARRNGGYDQIFNLRFGVNLTGNRFDEIAIFAGTGRRLNPPGMEKFLADFTARNPIATRESLRLLKEESAKRLTEILADELTGLCNEQNGFYIQGWHAEWPFQIYRGIQGLLSRDGRDHERLTARLGTPTFSLAVRVAGHRVAEVAIMRGEDGIPWTPPAEMAAFFQEFVKTNANADVRTDTTILNRLTEGFAKRLPAMLAAPETEQETKMRADRQAFLKESGFGTSGTNFFGHLNRSMTLSTSALNAMMERVSGDRASFINVFVERRQDGSIANASLRMTNRVEWQVLSVQEVIKKFIAGLNNRVVTAQDFVALYNAVKAELERWLPLEEVRRKEREAKRKTDREALCVGTGFSVSENGRFLSRYLPETEIIPADRFHQLTLITRSSYPAVHVHFTENNTIDYVIIPGLGNSGHAAAQAFSTAMTRFVGQTPTVPLLQSLNKAAAAALIPALRNATIEAYTAVCGNVTGFRLATDPRYPIFRSFTEAELAPPARFAHLRILTRVSAPYAHVSFDAAGNIEGIAIPGLENDPALLKIFNEAMAGTGVIGQPPTIPRMQTINKAAVATLIPRLQNAMTERYSALCTPGTGYQLSLQGQFPILRYINAADIVPATRFQRLVELTGTSYPAIQISLRENGNIDRIVLPGSGSRIWSEGDNPVAQEFRKAVTPFLDQPTSAEQLPKMHAAILKALAAALAVPGDDQEENKKRAEAHRKLWAELQPLLEGSLDEQRMKQLRETLESLPVENYQTFIKVLNAAPGVVEGALKWLEESSEKMDKEATERMETARKNVARDLATFAPDAPVAGRLGSVMTGGISVRFSDAGAPLATVALIPIQGREEAFRKSVSAFCQLHSRLMVVPEGLVTLSDLTEAEIQALPQFLRQGDEQGKKEAQDLQTFLGPLCTLANKYTMSDRPPHFLFASLTVLLDDPTYALLQTQTGAQSNYIHIHIGADRGIARVEIHAGSRVWTLPDSVQKFFAEYYGSEPTRDSLVTFNTRLAQVLRAELDPEGEKKRQQEAKLQKEAKERKEFLNSLCAGGNGFEVTDNPDFPIFRTFTDADFGNPGLRTQLSHVAEYAFPRMRIGFGPGNRIQQITIPSGGSGDWSASNHRAAQAFRKALEPYLNQPATAVLLGEMKDAAVKTLQAALRTPATDLCSTANEFVPHYDRFNMVIGRDFKAADFANPAYVQRFTAAIGRSPTIRIRVQSNGELHSIGIPSDYDGREFWSDGSHPAAIAFRAVVRPYVFRATPVTAAELVTMTQEAVKTLAAHPYDEAEQKFHESLCTGGFVQEENPEFPIYKYLDAADFVPVDRYYRLGQLTDCYRSNLAISFTSDRKIDRIVLRGHRTIWSEPNNDPVAQAFTKAVARFAGQPATPDLIQEIRKVAVAAMIPLLQDPAVERLVPLCTDATGFWIGTERDFPVSRFFGEEITPPDRLARLNALTGYTHAHMKIAFRANGAIDRIVIGGVLEGRPFWSASNHLAAQAFTKEVSGFIGQVPDAAMMQAITKAAAAAINTNLA